MSVTLEEHRKQTVNELEQLLKNNDKVCCVRPTGYGKTHYIAREIIREYKSKCLILIPNVALKASYRGMISDSQVITYQNLLYRNEEEMNNLVCGIDIIICDECHHLMAKKWGKCVELLNDLNKNIKILGLTATPLRADGIDVVKTFFKNVQCKPLNLMDSIDLKFIPKIKYVMGYCDVPENYIGSYKYELTEVDRYKIDNLLNIPNLLKNNISKDVVRQNMKVVVYISKLSEIFDAVNSCYKWFSEAFPSKFVNVYYLTSNKSQQWNMQQLYRFEQNNKIKDIDIIISVNKINEGTHIPNVNTSIFLNRTQSPVKYTQQLGRSLNGDRQAVIFDLARNGNNLQLLDGVSENSDDITSLISEKGKAETFNFSNYVMVLSFKKDIESILRKYHSNVVYLTDDMKNFIQYHPNLTNQQIAKILGVPVFKVTDYRRTNNLQYNKQHVKPLKNYMDYIKKYANTLGLTYISKELQCTRDSLRKFCSKNNIPYVLTDEDNINLEKRNEQIAKLCEEHPEYTDKYVATMFNIGARQVGTIRKIFNIPNCIERTRKAEYSKIAPKVIYDYENNKLSQKELMDKYGVTREVIKRILAQNNITSRSAKEFTELRTDMKVKELLKNKQDIINSYNQYGSESTRLRYKMSKSIQQQVFIQCELPLKTNSMNIKNCFKKLDDNKDFVLQLLSGGIDKIYTVIKQELKKNKK